MWVEMVVHLVNGLERLSLLPFFRGYGRAPEFLRLTTDNVESTIPPSTLTIVTTYNALLRPTFMFHVRFHIHSKNDTRQVVNHCNVNGGWSTYGAVGPIDQVELVE